MWAALDWLLNSTDCTGLPGKPFPQAGYSLGRAMAVRAKRTYAFSAMQLSIPMAFERNMSGMEQTVTKRQKTHRHASSGILASKNKAVRRMFWDCMCLHHPIQTSSILDTPIHLPTRRRRLADLLWFPISESWLVNLHTAPLRLCTSRRTVDLTRVLKVLSTRVHTHAWRITWHCILAADLTRLIMSPWRPKCHPYSTFTWRSMRFLAYVNTSFNLLAKHNFVSLSLYLGPIQVVAI